MIVIYPKDKDGFNYPGEEADKYDSASMQRIFLAGPCPRKDYDNDWRNEAIEYFKKHGYDGILYSPTNALFDRNAEGELARQTIWEIEAMQASDLVFFWIPRNKENPAFTTNIELGSFLLPNKIDRAIIGMPDWAEKNDYIKLRLKFLNKEYYNDLEEEVKKAIEKVDFSVSKDNWTLGD